MYTHYFVSTFDKINHFFKLLQWYKYSLLQWLHSSCTFIHLLYLPVSTILVFQENYIILINIFFHPVSRIFSSLGTQTLLTQPWKTALFSHLFLNNIHTLPAMQMLVLHWYIKISWRFQPIFLLWDNYSWNLVKYILKETIWWSQLSVC